MKKMAKTNAMRLLEAAGIPFQMHFYESDGFLDGVHIAEKIGQPLERTFKTLVTVGRGKEHYVFVIPVAEELDLKKAAKAVGEKAIEMIHVKEITPLTGYVRGGCSPIGMKKQFPTVVHTSAQAFDTIFFSGGRLGAQIEMDPKRLPEVIPAAFADLIVNADV